MSPPSAADIPAQKISSWLPGASSAARHVALGRLVVAALADELVGVAREAVGVGEVEEALDLVERLGVVLDAQVDAQPPRLALGGATTIADDWRPRTSPPAPSAARSAAIRRRASGPVAASNARAIAGHDLGARHHVGLDAEAVAGVMAGERDARRPGVGRHAAVGVDDGDLAERLA